MKKLLRTLWIESGWSVLTVTERIKMAYFVLSLFLLVASAESTIRVMALATINFSISGILVRTIKADIPDE